MGKWSKIEWCDHSWNPWIGCTKISDGCKFCYAEALDKRQMWDNQTHWGPTAPRRKTSESYWKQPHAWNQQAEREGKCYKVFCASLADVFEDHPQIQQEGWRIELWHLIEQTPNLEWLLLTKRPENVMDFVPELWKHGHWPKNVWTGASVEDQPTADTRIPIVLQIPGPHFLSCEPLLEPVDMKFGPRRDCYWCLGSGYWKSNGEPHVYACKCIIRNEHIHWVICGGESGPHARPMHPDWVRSLRDQAKSAGIPFFFKGWGEYRPADFGWKLPDGQQKNEMIRAGKKAAGRLLDGREWNEMPK